LKQDYNFITQTISNSVHVTKKHSIKEGVTKPIVEKLITPRLCTRKSFATPNYLSVLKENSRRDFFRECSDLMFIQPGHVLI
jgi:hypothetical protein